MNDRELTELAAKAAECYDLGDWDDKWNCLTNYEGWTFDPLTDDGDALRLAALLNLEIGWDDKYEKECKLAATRRAIVRAAAEIGREMKE